MACTCFCPQHYVCIRTYVCMYVVMTECVTMYYACVTMRMCDYVHASVCSLGYILVLFTWTASFYHLCTIRVRSLCGTYCCLSCALQSTTFLQPLIEKPQNDRGMYFGASTGPRLVHMKKVWKYVCTLCMWHDVSHSLIHTFICTLAIYIICLWRWMAVITGYYANLTRCQ